VEKHDPQTVTRLLHQWRDGDREALDRLVPLVYDELYELARQRLRGERPGHTIQATALVNEVYTRLVDMELSLEDRTHFRAIAARTMRHVLVDHARAKGRDKRGGGAQQISLHDAMLITTGRSEDLLALDRALDELAAIDARKTKAIELRYFGGMTYEETAMELGVSRATAHRELRLANAWLYRRLSGEQVERSEDS